MKRWLAVLFMAMALGALPFSAAAHADVVAQAAQGNDQGGDDDDQGENDDCQGQQDGEVCEDILSECPVGQLRYDPSGQGYITVYDPINGCHEVIACDPNFGGC